MGSESHYGAPGPAAAVPIAPEDATPTGRALHLTFDDGPDPDWTPRIMGVLARFEATATFFVLGWRMRERPELVDALLEAGHDVQLHGDAHLDHEVATLTQLVADTDRALALLRDHGVVPQWWRIPFGRLGPHTERLAEAHGVRIAGWDLDTTDWRGDGWSAQPDRVRAAARTGGTVLLHDAVAAGTPRTTADNTVEIVEALLRSAAHHRTEVRALPPAELAEDAVPVNAAGSPFARRDRALREALVARHSVAPPPGEAGASLDPASATTRPPSPLTRLRRR